MDRKSRQWVAATIFLVMVARAIATTPAAPISLEIAIPSTGVKVGSEIRVTVTVTNVTAEPIDIAVGTAELMYKIELRDVSGNSVPQRKYIRTLTLGPLKLGPGESHHDELVLSRIYDLSHPGTYVVQVRRQSRWEPEDRKSVV